MSEKMMRISGRGIDGTAKPIKTDNEGQQLVNIASDYGSKEYLLGEVILAGGNKYAMTSEVATSSSVRFVIRLSASSDFRVEVRHMTDSGVVLTSENYYYEYTGYASQQIFMKGKKYSIRIYNTGSSEITVLGFLVNNNFSGDLEDSESGNIKKPKTFENQSLVANTLKNLPSTEEAYSEFLTVGARGDTASISKTKIGVRWYLFGGKTSPEASPSDIEWLIDPSIDTVVSAPIAQTRMKARKFDVVMLSTDNVTLAYVGYTVMGGDLK